MFKRYAGKIAHNTNSVLKSEVLHICMLPMTPYISRAEGAATNCPAPHASTLGSGNMQPIGLKVPIRSAVFF